MKNTLKNGQQLSALADGQLQGAEAERALDWLVHDKDAQARWHTYHLLGDVMRAGAASCPDQDAAFMRRMRVALDKELPKTPQEFAINKEAAITRPHWLNTINSIKNKAANDALFHWRLAGGLASLLAVMVVAWQGLRGGFELGATPQLAQVSVPTGQPKAALAQVLVTAALPVMIRDPKLDAFLAAHKQFGGTSAFQKPAGFLSNAVFEGELR
jgi:sigma-E factor negative regulatory protein RseA